MPTFMSGPTQCRSALQELEDLVCDSLAQVLSAKSEVAHLRQRLETCEEAVERFAGKAHSLSKQNRGLMQVVRRYITDCIQAESKGSNKAVVPRKITREVGLTVNLTTTTVSSSCFYHC